MSDSVVETAPWSNRHWFVTIGVLFIGHIGLILFLSKPAPPPTEIARKTARIRIASSPAHESAQNGTSLRDPTFFALVHPQGFSGAAWLRPADYPYRMTNPMHPAMYLPSDPQKLADEFMELIQAKVTGPSFVLSKSTPALAEFPTPEGPLLLQPNLRIEGDLAGRSLAASKTLPPADPERILTNCVVAVVVAPSGDTLTATLRASSGSTKTDEAALAFSRTTRFVPLSPYRPAAASHSAKYFFGSLVFQWLPETLSPAATPNP